MVAWLVWNAVYDEIDEVSFKLFESFDFAKRNWNFIKFWEKILGELFSLSLSLDYLESRDKLNILNVYYVTN